MSKRVSAGERDEAFGEQPATVTAALTQVLAGTEVVLAPECGGCRRSILPDQTVTVYAYRRAHEGRWQVPQVYCPHCERTAIADPTAGWAEALVTATLDDAGSVCRLTPEAVIAWAGIDEGQ